LGNQNRPAGCKVSADLIETFNYIEGRSALPNPQTCTFSALLNVPLAAVRFLMPHIARLAAVLAFLAAASVSAAPDPAPISGVAPLVYQLDQSPTTHGYHYTFFGNAFFINDQGYLLTVAHVLETFRDGGQPYILVNRPNSPPRLLQVSVIATDPAHDIAILRATPNPFDSNYQVSFLP